MHSKVVDGWGYDGVAWRWGHRSTDQRQAPCVGRSGSVGGALLRLFGTLVFRDRSCRVICTDALSHATAGSHRSSTWGGVSVAGQRGRHDLGQRAIGSSPGEVDFGYGTDPDMPSLEEAEAEVEPDVRSRRQCCSCSQEVWPRADRCTERKSAAADRDAWQRR